MLPQWVLTLISVGASAIVSTVIGIIIKRSFDKYFQRKDREEAIKEAALKEAEELRKAEEERKLESMINKVVEVHTDPIDQKLDQMEDKLNKVANGTVDTLRDRILSAYYKCLDKGYRTQYDFENVHHMNTDYINLDGNTFVADCIQKFDALPSEEEFKLANKPKRTRKKKTTTTDKK